MKDKDYLRIKHLEDTLSPYRQLQSLNPPRRGWVRAIQEALGITNVQLAKRLGLRPQTIEDMQEYEANGTIKLQTLRKLAEALGCRVVYAVVPPQSLDEIRRNRAREIARRQIQRVSHTMKLEDQSISTMEEERQLEFVVQKLLAGNPKKLWE